jgi:TolA-binding protein
MAPRLDPEALGRAVAEVEDAALEGRPRPPTSERLARIHAALERRGARGPAAGSLRGPIAVGLALGALAAAVLLWPRPEPLRFAVGEPGEPAVAGAWVAAPAGGATPIGFSDGTRILVGTGARARVVSVGPKGARILVERGSVRADVVPRPGNDWWVVGGPFEIHVTGTSFDARWDPDRDALTVTMLRGRVAVRGPCLPAERVLVEREAATLSCTPPAAASSAAAAAPVVPIETTASAAASALPSAPVTHAAAAPSVVATPAASVAAAPSWRDLSRASRYKEALATAEGDGFGRLCDALGATDLMELAAAARLGGRPARAVEAYQAARRRFPGSDTAATAAFHLGQLAFDGAHALAEGRRWFLVYLGERPSGALAAEALGRVMEAEQRLGDLTAARATAERYLARFPGGAHAALARSLLAP